MRLPEALNRGCFFWGDGTVRLKICRREVRRWDRRKAFVQGPTSLLTSRAAFLRTTGHRADDEGRLVGWSGASRAGIGGLLRSGSRSGPQLQVESESTKATLHALCKLTLLTTCGTNTGHNFKQPAGFWG